MCDEADRAEETVQDGCPAQSDPAAFAASDALALPGAASGAGTGPTNARETAALATGHASSTPVAPDAPAHVGGVSAQPAAAPAEASPAEPSTTPIAAIAGQSAASTAAAATRPAESGHVVVRRLRAEEADRSSDQPAPRVDPTRREAEIRAPIPLLPDSPVTTDATQSPSDAVPTEVGAPEVRTAAEHIARAEAAIRHDAPRPVVQQIAEAARALGDGPVELTLQPEELGKVRMTMSAGADGTMTVSLQADRPETLDLLRRNIGELARDLQGLGFSNLSFSFGQDRASADTRQSGGEGEQPERTVAAVPLVGPSLATLPPTAPVSGGLDLRL